MDEPESEAANATFANRQPITANKTAFIVNSLVRVLCWQLCNAMRRRSEYHF